MKLDKGNNQMVDSTLMYYQFGIAGASGSSPRPISDLALFFAMFLAQSQNTTSVGKGVDYMPYC